MKILLIILAIYVAQIFICRQMNLWMMKNADKHPKKRKSDYFMAVGAWFIPFFGFCFIAYYAFELKWYTWKDNPLMKWFAEGEEFKWK